MEQRRLRLGDILDDYCPRERRVTNHAVVAMVEEDVKQTRCTTCDTEHVYKGGKTPRRKKGDTTSKLYKQVLDGLDKEAAAAHAADQAVPGDPEPDSESIDAAADVEAIAAADNIDEPEAQEPDAVEIAEIEEDVPMLDDGPVHRPLIRAQLPRVEGVKLERQAPDFTIRQANSRGNANFRGHGQNGGQNNNGGHRFGRGPQRGSGGSGRGGSQGFGGGRQGQGPQRNKRGGR